MKRVSVAELEPGRRINSVFLLQAKERKTARNGSAYLDLEFKDATGAVRGKLWDCDRLKADYEVDDFVLIDGNVELYQGTLQISVREIRRSVEVEVNLLDFLPRTRYDPDQMYAAILQRLQSEPEGPLKQLLLAVFEDPILAEKYKLAPAATTLHHAFLGGLLEHVSSLWQLGDRLCEHYPWLNRSLVLTGVLLHDLGKVEELHFQRSFRYSTRGQLLGHITIALEMIHEKIRAIPGFPETLKHQVEHLILSHHGKLEFGSPKEPMFPEALAVHYLDELDSKLESMRAQYETEKDRPGPWTSRNRALGRELLKIDP
ncbi:MAG: 3'-5' exoribonuclease YhaM family protein [Terriglobia bacterium]